MILLVFEQVIIGKVIMQNLIKQIWEKIHVEKHTSQNIYYFGIAV